MVHHYYLTGAKNDMKQFNGVIPEHKVATTEGISYQPCLMAPQKGNWWLGWVNRDPDTPLLPSTKRNPSNAAARGHSFSSLISANCGTAIQLPAGIWYDPGAVYGAMTLRGTETVVKELWSMCVQSHCHIHVTVKYNDLRMGPGLKRAVSLTKLSR